MNIDIVAVGRLREKFYNDAAAEYMKRLQRYAKVRILEADEVKKPDEVSPALSVQIREKEAERLKKFYRPGAYRIALCIDGKQLDSVEFSHMIDETLLSGHDSIQFFIGGAIGLGDSLVTEADLRLSFSKMTFPHQLMRVILLEQIYRAFRIMKGEPYHK